MRVGEATRRRGFTLIEMLVVIVITIIVLGMVLVPLSQSLNLTGRARSMVSSQDSLRTAIRRMMRELSQAMIVFEPRAITLWHYSAYTVSGDQPTPVSTAVPVPYSVNDGMLVFALPKHRYYCTKFDHYLLDTEVSPLAAIDTCVRAGHQGSPVELRPLQPLQPEPVWVAYFIGLKQPGYPAESIFDPGTTPPGQPGNSDPHYVSPLFVGLTGGFDNQYVLYRVEIPTVEVIGPDGKINPAGRLNNFFLWNPDGTLRGPNSNFFYDRTLNAGGVPYYREWRSRAIPLITVEDTDQVQLTRLGDGQWRPMPMTRFAASAVESDPAAPNRRAGVPVPGGVQTSEIQPEEYLTEYGYWTGLFNDGGSVIPDGLRLSNSGTPAADFAFGPRIEVYQGDTLVFDSAQAGGRARLVSYDANRGVVRFAIRRSRDPDRDPFPGEASDPEAYSAIIERDPASGQLTASLSQDDAQRISTLGGVSTPMPGGLGSARLRFPSAQVVPFSETVSRVNQTTGEARLLRRAGWSGLGSLDRRVAPADLAADEYTIDYRSGRLFFSDDDPSLALVGPGSVEELWVKYQFQTNTSEDVVRVTYATREMMTVNLGLVQYSPQTHEALPTQVTQRIRVRNLAR
ncbi:MAG: prepilin-type N-terminal cleavage/methylation domain-containing protein [Armatimonadetes bacterium]|nr:prepilin-type N-terminal cleavage/methylation domain-containing protein [Armatimonadota bacterium]